MHAKYREGSAYYDHHKRQSARQKTDSDGLRQAVSGAGLQKTTVAEIVHKAAVSNSIFQNIFRAKDGVLTELAEFMFSNQFSMARDVTGKQLPPPMSTPRRPPSR